MRLGGVKAKIICLMSVITMGLSAAVMGTFAWFKGEISLSGLTGGMKGAYFAGGVGSAENPYQITHPIHLYNLAWLQYLGTFNGDKDVLVDGSSSSVNTDSAGHELTYRYHFVLKNDLDMTGWALPPIGTEQYPFIGHFDGNNKTISNLLSTNDLIGRTIDVPTSGGSTSSTAVRVPQIIGTWDSSSSDGSHPQPNIVGFFGVIGNLVGSNGESLNSKTYYYDSSTDHLENVTLNSITVESRTSNTLIGLAAGYVNDDISGVKVDGASKIDLSNQSSSAISGITGNLSDYGLVGYSTKTDRSGSYSQNLSKYYDSKSGSGGSGSGDDWGGSINMKSLNIRLKNMLNDSEHLTYYLGGNKAAADNNKTLLKYSDDYNFITSTWGTTSLDTYFTKNPESTRVYYRLNGSGTYYNSRKKVDHVMPGTCIPLLTSSETSFVPIQKNTGYIIGGSNGKTNTGKYNYGIATSDASSPTITSSSYELELICHSLADGTYDENAIAISSIDAGVGPYSSSKFEILTNSSANYGEANYVAIKDSYNTSHSIAKTSPLSGYLKDDSTTPESLGLEKYQNSRDSLDDILSGSSYIQGIHFNEPEEAISISNTISMPHVIIGNKNYTNYPFPQSCIDFNLKKHGKINFFAGSYYATGSSPNAHSGADSFFSLHRIVRNAETNALISINEISNIYVNNAYTPGSTVIPKYIYKYSNNTYSDTGTTTASSNLGTMLFDMLYLTSTPPVRNAVYYFEIPVNSGEYAMGVVNGKSGGSYLMYLDIGASLEVTDRVTAYSITTLTTGAPYPLGVDFAPITVFGNGGDTIAFAIASGKTGSLFITVETRTSSITVTGSNSIADYAYRSQNCVSSTPTTANQFTCNLSGAPPSSTEGVRVLNIGLSTAAGNDYRIRVTDNLDDGNNITSSTYELYSGSGFVTRTLSEIAALSSSMDLDELRSLEIAASLTRASGTGEFITTYDTDSCDDTTINVNIVPNGTTISISVTSGYTFKIGGTPYSDGLTYSAS